MSFKELQTINNKRLSILDTWDITLSLTNENSLCIFDHYKLFPYLWPIKLFLYLWPKRTLPLYLTNETPLSCLQSIKTLSLSLINDNYLSIFDQWETMVFEILCLKGPLECLSIYYNSNYESHICFIIFTIK